MTVSSILRRLIVGALVLFVLWCAYAIISGLAFGQTVPNADEITYAESYQIAKKVGTPWVVVLKSSNNPLQAVGIIDAWREVAHFATQDEAESYLYRLIHEPDAPVYERLSCVKYGKDLQTRLVQLP